MKALWKLLVLIWIALFAPPHERYEQDAEP